MKPQKNHIFCPQCNKHKMQFTTAEEADRFLSYNSDEILVENGHAPIRSYFCSACNCWHVTSNPYAYNGAKDLQLPREMRYMEKTAKAAIRENIREIKEILHKINRFVTGHGGEEPEPASYYQSLFDKVQEELAMITDCLSKKQLDNINHRICIVRPLIANM